jgi:dienelactone hydrolase
MAVAARETLEQRIAALEPGIDVYKPDGPGPFPVVIQLHGCGGRKDFQTEWAEVVKAEGWAAVVVDSYRHRRISTIEAYTTVCTGLQLWGQERAGDLFAALEWVRRQDWADTSTIVAAGWSHGGWTALDAMAMQPGEEAERTTRVSGLPDEPLEGLAGAFLVYPFAGPGSMARMRGLRCDVAPLALVGTADIIVGGRSLGRTLQRMETPGTPIEVVLLEGATHAFDEKDARDIRVRFNPELVETARGFLRDYLAKVSAKASRRTPA